MVFGNIQINHLKHLVRKFIVRFNEHYRRYNFKIKVNFTYYALGGILDFTSSSQPRLFRHCSYHNNCALTCSNCVLEWTVRAAVVSELHKSTKIFSYPCLQSTIITVPIAPQQRTNKSASRARAMCARTTLGRSTFIKNAVEVVFPLVIGSTPWP